MLLFPDLPEAVEPIDIDKLLARLDARTYLVHKGRFKGCWNATFRADGGGYPQVQVGGRFYRLSRLSFQIFYGPIPEGSLVLHCCDNRRCCNPDHLRLGDHAANAADRDAKGRHRGGPNAPRGFLPRYQFARRSAPPRPVQLSFSFLDR